MGELSFSSSSSLVSWALKLIPSQKMDIIMNSSGKKHNLFLFQLSSLVLQITKDDNHNLEPWTLPLQQWSKKSRAWSYDYGLLTSLSSVY